MQGGKGTGTSPGTDETRLTCHSSLPIVPKASNSPPHTTIFFIICSSHHARFFPSSPPDTPAGTAHLTGRKHTSSLSMRTVRLRAAVEEATRGRGADTVIRPRASVPTSAFIAPYEAYSMTALYTIGVMPD
jgi:hypothetical protein